MKKFIIALFFGVCLFLGIKVPNLIAYMKAGTSTHSYFVKDKRELSADEAIQGWGADAQSFNYYENTSGIMHVVFAPLSYTQTEDHIWKGFSKEAK
jgi:hypothetical protein